VSKYISFAKSQQNERKCIILETEMEGFQHSVRDPVDKFERGCA
jgi:hypothetical protein